MSNKTYRAIGLMSGTSSDGIDAALITIQENPLKVSLDSFKLFPYAASLQTRIRNAFSAKTRLQEIGELDMLIGEAFSQAVLSLLKNTRTSPQKIDFIGSHGQTVFHQPPSSVTQHSTPFTMQLGDGSVIAQRTGIVTVSDFRVADVAQGGEGAPLIPYVDWRLFSSSKKRRVLLNLGGIANFTYLPPKAKLSDITACDTGPGNVLLDSLITLITDGKQKYDKDGKLASHGKIDPEILSELMRHPFLQKSLPKSAERSTFGLDLAQKLTGKWPQVTLEDWLATAAAFTAHSIARHIRRHAKKGEELFVSGGGTKNEMLLRLLKETLEPNVQCRRFDELGFPGKAKEALAFAFLAFETLKGRASNVPKVTGAKRACVLGKISPGWLHPWKLL